MSIYEYYCPKCDRTEDRMFKMGLAPDSVIGSPCPKNKGKDCELARSIAVSNFKVKGGTPTHHRRAPRK